MELYVYCSKDSKSSLLNVEVRLTQVEGRYKGFRLLMEP